MRDVDAVGDEEADRERDLEIRPGARGRQGDAGREEDEEEDQVAIEGLGVGVELQALVAAAAR